MASRICSHSLSISYAIIVVFSTRIFQNLDLGIEWVLRCKLESLRCIISCLERVEVLRPTYTLFSPYTSKQPLMMVCEGSESAQNNFGKFIHQFQPETKTLIRKLKRIVYKLYWQNLSLLFNETSIATTPKCRGGYHYTKLYIHLKVKWLMQRLEEIKDRIKHV